MGKTAEWQISYRQRRPILLSHAVQLESVATNFSIYCLLRSLPEVSLSEHHAPTVAKNHSNMRIPCFDIDALNLSAFMTNTHFSVRLQNMAGRALGVEQMQLWPTAAVHRLSAVAH